MLRALADHHRFDGTEFHFDNDWPVVCTEKDAIKITENMSDWAAIEREIWYLEIDVVLDADAEQRLETLLCEHGIAVK